ncbi:hypothetical protein QUB80_03815 [Chlorogloeopsis sp. ULAP01]|uniref:hypothetical protein n=1 Tax=Chlorogloeopsis sp. ULAP01 TaxID=3056483 RepID=UPI0025AA94E5|nr:hypothetical protein [Chlorogloeopsis sp. ULAP01]MDM9379823.1 hypothetical protein [Chlorogloeopsis sp. ULAP01]
MTNKKPQKRTFKGMSYCKVQGANSKNRNKLHKEDKQWLKDNGYRNVGWDNIINLYQKIEEIVDRYPFEDLTLEELFIEADRIGNKYLTAQEREEFNQKLAQEVNEIAEEIDRQFPDTEIEVIDFSKKISNNSRKKRNQKSYRTVKF